MVKKETTAGNATKKPAEKKSTAGNTTKKPAEKKSTAAAKTKTKAVNDSEVAETEVTQIVVNEPEILPTDVANLSVEQKLSNLYHLQSILSEIDKIKTLRGELPLEVQDLEDEVAGLQTRIQNYHLDIKDIDTSIGQQRMKITDANALITRYKEQLDNVRNNREFDNLSKEIVFQGLEVELAEKKIREFTAKSKTVTEEIAKSKIALEERQIDLKIKKQELNEIVSETKIQEEQLREKAKKLETTIEQRLLTAFKRIRKSARNGLAVVYIQRDACGGCFNKIPPQRQLDIKLRKKTIVCEHCGRILIDPQLAGVE
ncbi:MAG: C4-type zinc ribbon domain-containing protein [Dysgonamonadaceae bacterium]|jgi:predicted  nucleic acid-binding Zn-ribbon protein|nr:C4-type zinc ribbon domain-containing protein [Dysgonamonadaceae bacterium]